MPGKLNILAARPSMGKTALALSMGRYGVRRGIPTLIFSLEMMDFDLMKRFNAMDLDVGLSKFVYTGPSEQELEAVRRNDVEIDKLPLYFVDSVFDIGSILSIAKSAVRKYKIKHIIIDYLQLVNAGAAVSKNSTREAQVSHVSRALKELSMTLKIPIMALSQLNRGVDSRGNPRPRLSDLRESGAIEQDADMVMFLYRPEVYGIKEVDLEDAPGTSSDGFAEIIIGKHRNGACKTCYAHWNAKTTRFKDWTGGSEKLEEAPKPEDSPF